MCTEYEGVSALQENITMGDLWLKGMADGAASSGRTVQYCSASRLSSRHAPRVLQWSGCPFSQCLSSACVVRRLVCALAVPYPNQVLSAVSYAAVTNARATGDYFHAAHQWAIGATSLFYWAIGILPCGAHGSQTRA
jgi:hypothetical protein